jgi:predicted nuclease of predicted toxin-antitoxin system
MSAALYFDVQVPRAICFGLRRREIDVLLAQEDHADRLPDSDLMDRALQLNRIVVTCDDDFLRQAKLRQRLGAIFPSIAYAHQFELEIGPMVASLEIISKALEEHELANHIFYLPF